MNNPWTTRVKCQGPGCDKSVNVTKPGEVRPGWTILLQQVRILDASKQSAPDQPKQTQYLPFCGLTCLYNWVKARLPSKAGKKE